MRKSDSVWPLIAACLVTAGCISTTTGPAEPDADRGDAAELNYQLGARYYRNGKYELARDRLLYSIELDPKRAIAHSTLALTYEQLGNIRLATESYERAVRVAPRNFDVLNAYGVFLCRQKRFDEAEEHFERAVREETNDNPEIMLTNAGVCMKQKPDAAKAEEFFRRALDAKPGYGEALIQLSVLKYGERDYLNARAFLQRYLRSNPASASVLYLGVQIENDLGDERAKSEYADRILREYPTSPEARQILDAG
jgi:type IV pilus assembly protein PilF